MKMDRKLISMEKHEIRYVRKLAKKFLTKVDKHSTRHYLYPYWKCVMFSRLTPAQIKRICKLLLKLIK